MLKTPFILAIIFCLFTNQSDAQSRKKWYDGPYISIKDTTMYIKWVEKGKRKKDKFPVGTKSSFEVNGLPLVDLTRLNFERDTISHFVGVKRFAAISDVHGQYDLMVRLLESNGVIDSMGNWKFGQGHLVVLGDIFDRGDKVTECLWFLFNLEKQALESGGKLHFLLGNHELMVMHGDRTYINPKYIYTAGKLGIDYHDLFDDSTILGQWLRSKPVSVSIGDFVFVHGGFSKKVLERESSLMKINEVFNKVIVPNPEVAFTKDELLKALYFESGPLWYRGYAEPKNFDINQAEYVLNTLDKESIVIGHTSMPQIYSLFANRVILIDSSIKFGRSGEMLLYENDLLYRGQLNGERILLQSDASNTKNNSIFYYLSEVVGDNLSVDLHIDFDTLLATKLDESYWDGRLVIKESGEELLDIEMRARTRGNMRKKICDLPPLKIDFNKKALKKLGYAPLDKIKLVVPCLDDSQKTDYLFREYLVYKMYEEIDTLALRTKLIDLRVFDTNGDTLHVPAFILEDEENYSRRIGGEIVESGVIRSEGLNRQSYLRLAFFQYLIANSDWSISGRHNINTIKFEHMDRLVAAAYDFDYCGIVNQEYSNSAHAFPRVDMDQKKIRLKQISRDEIRDLLAFYNPKKKTLMRMCEEADYLSEESKDRFVSVIRSFYATINSRKQRELFFPPIID